MCKIWTNHVRARPIQSYLNVMNKLKFHSNWYFCCFMSSEAELAEMSVFFQLWTMIESLWKLMLIVHCIESRVLRWESKLLFPSHDFSFKGWLLACLLLGFDDTNKFDPWATNLIQASSLSMIDFYLYESSEWNSWLYDAGILNRPYRTSSHNLSVSWYAYHIKSW